MAQGQQRILAPRLEPQLIQLHSRRIVKASSVLHDLRCACRRRACSTHLPHPFRWQHQRLISKALSLLLPMELATHGEQLVRKRATGLVQQLEPTLLQLVCKSVY